MPSGKKHRLDISQCLNICIKKDKTKESLRRLDWTHADWTANPLRPAVTLTWCALAGESASAPWCAPAACQCSPPDLWPAASASSAPPPAWPAKVSAAQTPPSASPAPSPAAPAGRPVRCGSGGSTSRLLLSPDTEDTERSQQNRKKKGSTFYLLLILFLNVKSLLSSQNKSET